VIIILFGFFIAYYYMTYERNEKIDGKKR
jgi:cbb3-type cytochrome oxidase subunit 3